MQDRPDILISPERQEIEEALQPSHQAPQEKTGVILPPDESIGSLELEDIIDVPAIQALMDDFYAVTQVGIGIIDLKGKVLVGTGWQEVCTQFHRRNPESCKACIESDLELTTGIAAGEFRLYRCKNNMWDFATPIVIGGQHMGNVFLGQFLFDDEVPDEGALLAQADRFGFNQGAYLEATRRVPRWSRDFVHNVMRFYAGFSHLISSLSYNRLKLARTLEARGRAESELHQAKQRLELAASSAQLGVWDWDLVSGTMIWDDRMLEIYGLTRETSAGSIEDWQRGVHPEDFPRAVAECQAALDGKAPFDTIFRVRWPDGEVHWVKAHGLVQRDEQGKPVRMLGINRDITAQVREQEVQQQDLKRLETLNRILQHHADSTQAFLDNALDEAIHLTGSQIGYIYFYSEERQEFELNTWSKEVMDECRVVAPQSCYALANTGVWGEAVRQRQPILINDYPAQHPLKKGYPEGHVHLRKFMTVPVFQGDQIVAVIGLANKESDYDDKDVLQVGLLMDGVWKAVRLMKVQEAIQEREELLRLSLQGADLGAWDWDIPTDRISVNERYLTMLGLGTDAIELSARGWVERVHPDDLPGVQAAIQAHLRGETRTYESEHRLRHTSGDWIWVLDRGGVLKRSPEGEPLRMCGTHLDVTEWKWTTLLEAARLRLMEYSVSHSLDELLQKTIDEACALTESVDGFYHLVEKGERTIELHAWSTRTEQEFCRATGKGSHHPVNQAGIWADCLRERRPIIHNDYKALPGREGLPHGHAEIIREMVVPLFREDRIIALLGVGNKPGPYRARDIELVQRLLDHAWSIIERKRTELAKREVEQQLQQSQKMESLGNLAGGIAHDLNNVLAAVLGMASASRGRFQESDPMTKVLDTITKACTRGRDVVKSLLIFARRELGETKPLDLNALVRESVELLSHSTLKRVDLLLDLEEPLPEIQGDSAALSHCLINLSVNAVDAMPGQGTVTFRTRRIPGEGISLSVRDTGTGMSPEVLERAMEPFFTTKPQGKGTGLGLSMVYGTMQAHDGSLSIQSRLGEGTEVVLSFPESRLIEATPPEATFPRVTSPTRALRILVVDDDDLVRATLGMMLEVLGHKVTLASGGEEALQRIKGGLDIDLVVLDMNMPGQTGIQTLAQLRILRPHQRVLLASGHTDEALESIVAADPELEFISKPFDLSDLTKRLNGSH